VVGLSLVFQYVNTCGHLSTVKVIDLSFRLGLLILFIGMDKPLPLSQCLPSLVVIKYPVD